MHEKNPDLIKDAQKGDLAAFRELINLYSPRIHSIAYQIVGNTADSQDITQDVFLRLYRSLNKFNPEYRFTTWLYRVTVNIAVDYQRKNSGQPDVALDEIADHSVAEDIYTRPVAYVEHNQLKGIISRLADNLSIKQRRVFILRDLQGFSTSEVARILDCSQITVRVHLAKARARIKTALLKYYPDLDTGKSSEEVNINEMPKS